MKTVADLKAAELYGFTAIDGLMAGLIQIEEGFLETQIVIFDGVLGLHLLLCYLFELLLEEHLDDEALAADFLDLDVGLDEVDGAFVAVVMLSLVGPLE
jgi:hypothetical protein